MTKKKVTPPADVEQAPMDNVSTNVEVTDVGESSATPEPNAELIDNAIAEGMALINLGKPKIEAAMLIYAKLEVESQETVVDAFIKGASLTPKGALTYWYNCRRKVRKQRLVGTQKD